MLKILAKSLLTLAILTVIVGGIVGVFAINIIALQAAAPMMVPPPETVATDIVKKLEWRRESKAVGSIEAVQGVTLSNEQPGLVSKILFESGQDVKAGEPLIELNSETELAQLASAKASQKLARLNLNRAKELYDKETISKAELDVAQAEAANANAQVKNIEAIIAKRTIYAPFTGRLGIRQIDLGEYLNPGVPIITLQSQDPVYATFSLPQRELAELAAGLTVTAATDAVPGETFKGTITAIESEVDPATRNIRIQATIGNPEGKLKPGMFVNIVVEFSETREVFAIPSTSVAYASYGNRVFTAEPSEDGKGLIAIEHFVKLGETRGDFVEVVKGIESDARVVTEGAFKLRPGMPISTNDEQTPSAVIDPNLADS
ncbi:MAG: efflux RND transporter periplasmic adaptor subunit [Verrucomicrobiota bacterium]